MGLYMLYPRPVNFVLSLISPSLVLTNFFLNCVKKYIPSKPNYGSFYKQFVIEERNHYNFERYIVK